MPSASDSHETVRAARVGDFEPSDGGDRRPFCFAESTATSWFATHAANFKPGNTVAVVGDGAIGLQIGIRIRESPAFGCNEAFLASDFVTQLSVNHAKKATISG
jgi:threonine dehydrogenase-like Zn-dependent dehydrogenase